MAIPYKIKKTFGFALTGMIPLFVFVVCGLLQMPILESMIFALLAVLASAFVGMAIIHHPLLDIIEGRGLLTISLSSTGISRIFNTRVIAGTQLALKVNGKWYSQMYNRTIGWYLNKVEKAQAINTEGGLELKLPTEKKAINTWAFEGRPMLIWNEKAESFLDKETVAEMENTIMTENLSLGLMNQVNKLREDMHQFTRHFSDLFNPSFLKELLSSPWARAIGVILLVIIIGMFLAPEITEFLGMVSPEGEVPGGGNLFG